MPIAGHDKPSSTPAFSTLVLVLVAVYGYLSYEPPLKTARPPSPSGYEVPPPVGTDLFRTVPARVWEDPLRVAHSDRPGRKTASSFLSWSAQYTASRVRSHFRDNVFGDNENADYLLMPVLLTGGPFADDKEQRLRIRYAVFSALGSRGYYLSFPERMTSIDVPVDVQVLPDAEPRNIELRVPLKLFSSDRTGTADRDAPEQGSGMEDEPQYDRILVLWLNEDLLGRKPISVVAQLLEYFLGNDVGLDIALIGPTGSDALARFANEECDLAEYPWMQSDEKLRRIFSPRATVPLGRLDAPDPPGFCGFDLTHVIGSDAELIEPLRRELGLRDAWPEKGSDDYVVIITERDTAYGQQFPEVLRSHGELADGQVREIKYGRGMDGRRPGDEEAMQNSGDGDNADHGAAVPEGRSQLDYLRGIERRLVELQESPVTGEMKAVGVVGTDLYDKLLVLRALRNRFPRTRFFTTDLDARLGHPSEYEAARNLIVASHFGLRLSEKLQGDAPPFRGSYQTATFLATLLALNDPDALRAVAGSPKPEPEGLAFWRRANHGVHAGVLSPLVYEIASNGPQRFTSLPAGPSRGTHPASSAPPGWTEVLGVSGIALAVLFLLAVASARVQRFFDSLWQAVRGRGSPSAYMALALAVASLLVVVAMAVDQLWERGEPWNPRIGISIWPATMVRLAAAVVAVACVRKGCQELRENQVENRDSMRSAGLEPPASPARNVWEEKAMWDLREVAWGTGMLLVAGALLLGLTGLPNLPHRGWISRGVGTAVLIGAVVSMFFLVVFVLQVLRRTREFVRDQVEERSSKTIRSASIEGLQRVKAIASKTDVASKQMYCPCIVVLLMALSRNPWFDDFDFPLGLVFLILSVLLATVAGAVFVRLEAERARGAIAGDLQQRLAQAPANSSNRRAHWILEEIRDERGGAFRPLLRDPAFQVVALPLGGFGGLALLEGILGSI